MHLNPGLDASPEAACAFGGEVTGQRPGDSEHCRMLGAHLLASGQPVQAAACFRAALELEPGSAVDYFNLGLALRNQGDAIGASRSFQMAWKLDSSLYQALFALANLFLYAGDLERAEDCLGRVVEIAPEFADAHYNLGCAAKARGAYDAAAAAFRRALELSPDLAEASNNLGLIHKEREDLGAAIACYRRAIALKPGLAEAHYNLGIAAQLRGQYRESLAHFQEALRRKPDYAPAKWLYLLSLPILYESADDVLCHRQRFAANLDGLVAGTPLDTPQQRAHGLEGIGSTTHFFLQYQGQNDRELQCRYGRFAVRVMAASYPQWSGRRPMPLLEAGGRIRIGYVSSFMRSHTIGHFLLGWLQGHQRDGFEFFSYHIGDKTDPETLRIARLSDHFHQIGNRLEKAAARIAADNLHLLVFTDIGMNPLATQLAALRLAPVQCKGWGHPVTTGLPTIDYYLSSDLMEPANAREHYSETLIRLPNLALYYAPPPLPGPSKTRAELGLRGDAMVYLNSQSLFKNLPQHDDIYPRIASKVPGSQFVFIAHSQPEVTRQFAERLARAFQDCGLRLEDHCLFLPRMNHPDFLSLNLAADVLLDTLEWSGGKTTLEALSCGLPVVTLPGGFMRARHAFAMLTRMGETETVAETKEDYVRLAVRLGQDADFHATIRRRVSANRDRLFHDVEFMRALEEFYRSTVRRSARAA